MSVYWWLTAACLIVAYQYAMRIGPQMVQRWTGREYRRRQASIGFDAISYGLTFLIAIPPIFLIRDADPLVYLAFFMLGTIVADLTAQYIYGRKSA